MIIEQLLDDSNLTASEKSIAQYLLDPKHDITQMTGYELGKQSYTSQSAVVRLYKKLGLKNFREFMSIFQLERNEYFKHNRHIGDTPSTFFTSLNDIQMTISFLYQEAINKTNAMMNANVVTRLCNRIINASVVDVYGLGISETSAKEMVFKLRALGIAAQIHDGVNEFYIKNLNPKTSVSILISQTGKNETMIRVAKLLKARGVYVVGLIGRKDDAITSSLSDYLLFDTNEFKDIDCLYSTFACDYLINVIYANLIYRKQTSQLLTNKD